MYLRTVVRDSPVPLAICRWLMPDCQRRTTSVTSTLDTSLYAIAAPYIQDAAMVANPAHRVINLLAKWPIVPGDLSFYWYIVPGVRQSRSIPACAGEPDLRAVYARHRKVYPRVCGGTGYGGRSVIWRHGLSPACAGEPSGRNFRPAFDTVYSRVCGVTTLQPCTSAASYGLSPRVVRVCGGTQSRLTLWYTEFPVPRGPAHQCRVSLISEGMPHFP